MITDSTEFKYFIHVAVAASDWNEYLEWGKENNIKIAYSFGRLYFSNEEEAIMFRLRFAV